MQELHCLTLTAKHIALGIGPVAQRQGFSSVQFGYLSPFVSGLSVRIEEKEKTKKIVLRGALKRFIFVSVGTLT